MLLGEPPRKVIGELDDVDDCRCVCHSRFPQILRPKSVLRVNYWPLRKSVTSEQLSLLPARRDDDAAPLGRLELASGGVLQLGEAVGTEIGQCVPLEPAPEEFDRIELRRIARQEVELDAPGGRSDVVAYQMTAMRPGAVQDDEQRTAEVSQQRFEKVDHLFSGNGAFMQAKAQAREVHAGDQRQLVPVEMKLQRRRLASDTPGAHPRGPLRDSGLVDEDDQSSLASGVFFSAGQVRLRPCSMAA